MTPVLALAEGGKCVTCHRPHAQWQGECSGCHRGNPATVRRELAHAGLLGVPFAHAALPGSPVTEAGRQLLDRSGCRRCHRSGEKGNRLAGDLDQVFPALRVEEAVRALRQPAQFMPDFAFGHEPAALLVTALLANAAQAPPPAGETPRVVHFAVAADAENPFARHCGGCHRQLTTRWGGLGKGTIGPNLSGLYSEFYPRRFKDAEHWTPANLEKWLKNPRESREAARMAPQKLTPVELRGVLEVFADQQASVPANSPPGARLGEAR